MNRRENLLFKLRSTLKECGVDFISTIDDHKYIESFIIDYDNGKNHGDNIEITVKEFLEYCDRKEKEEETNDDPTLD